MSNATSRYVLINSSTCCPVSGSPISHVSTCFYPHPTSWYSRRCVSPLRFSNSNTLAITNPLVTTNLRSVNEIFVPAWARTYDLGFEKVSHSWLTSTVLWNFDQLLPYDDRTPPLVASSLLSSLVNPVDVHQIHDEHWSYPAMA